MPRFHTGQTAAHTLAGRHFAAVCGFVRRATAVSRRRAPQAVPARGRFALPYTARQNTFAGRRGLCRFVRVRQNLSPTDAKRLTVPFEEASFQKCILRLFGFILIHIAIAYPTRADLPIILGSLTKFSQNGRNFPKVLANFAVPL